MRTIPWFDFTTHNTINNTQLRAFSINHPAHGNLIIFKGVNGQNVDHFLANGFVQTKDNAFAIPAMQFKGSMITDHFDSVTVVATPFDQVDLTSQLSNNTKPNKQPAQSEAESNNSVKPNVTGTHIQADSDNDTETPNPVIWPDSISAIVALLVERAEAQANGTRAVTTTLPNDLAQTLNAYLSAHGDHGMAVDGRDYHIIENDSVYHQFSVMSNDLSPLTKVNFIQSLSLAALQDINTQYNPLAIIRPDSDIRLEMGDAVFGTQHTDRVGQIFFTRKANAKSTLLNHVDDHTLTTTLHAAPSDFNNIASVYLSDDDKAVTLNHVFALLSDSDREAFIAEVNLPNITVDSPAFTVLPSAFVAKSPTFQNELRSRGFDSLAFYSRPDDNGLTIINLLDRQFDYTLVETIENPNYTPAEFEKIVSGTGLVGLMHKETQHVISDNHHPWFSTLVAARAAIDLDENQLKIRPDAFDTMNNQSGSDVENSDIETNDAGFEADDTPPSITAFSTGGLKIEGENALDFIKATAPNIPYSKFESEGYVKIAHRYRKAFLTLINKASPNEVDIRLNTSVVSLNETYADIAGHDHTITRFVDVNGNQFIEIDNADFLSTNDFEHMFDCDIINDNEWKENAVDLLSQPADIDVKKNNDKVDNVEESTNKQSGELKTQPESDASDDTPSNQKNDRTSSTQPSLSVITNNDALNEDNQRESEAKKPYFFSYQLTPLGINADQNRLFGWKNSVLAKDQKGNLFLSPTVTDSDHTIIDYRMDDGNKRFTAIPSINRGDTTSATGNVIHLPTFVNAETALVDNEMLRKWRDIYSDLLKDNYTTLLNASKSYEARDKLFDPFSNKANEKALEGHVNTLTNYMAEKGLTNTPPAFIHAVLEDFSSSFVQAEQELDALSTITKPNIGKAYFDAMLNDFDHSRHTIAEFAKAMDYFGAASQTKQAHLAALALGTEEDIHLTKNWLSSNDKERAIQWFSQFSETLCYKDIYTQGCISIDQFISNTDDSLSPLPRRYANERLRSHSIDLAHRYFDHEALNVTQDDKDMWLNAESSSEFFALYSKKYHIPYWSCEDVSEKITASITKDRAKQYQQGEECKKLTELGKSVQAQLNSQSVDVDVKTPTLSDQYIRFDIGSGYISASLFSQDDNTDQIHCRFTGVDDNSRSMTIIEFSENSALDILSFAALHDSMHITQISKDALFASQSSEAAPDSHNITAINKAIRGDIKKAISQGFLPPGIKTTVKKSHREVSILITDVDSEIKFHRPEFIEYLRLFEVDQRAFIDKPAIPKKYTPDGFTIMSNIRKIVDQYRYDNSDAMTDYFDFNFILSLTVGADILEREKNQPHLAKTHFESVNDNSVTLTNDNEILMHLSENGFAYDDKGQRYGMVFNASNDQPNVVCSNGTTFSSFDRDWALTSANTATHDTGIEPSSTTAPDNNAVRRVELKTIKGVLDAYEFATNQFSIDTDNTGFLEFKLVPIGSGDTAFIKIDGGVINFSVGDEMITLDTATADPTVLYMTDSFNEALSSINLNQTTHIPKLLSGDMKINTGPTQSSKEAPAVTAKNPMVVSVMSMDDATFFPRDISILATTPSGDHPEFFTLNAVSAISDDDWNKVKIHAMLNGAVLDSAFMPDSLRFSSYDTLQSWLSLTGIRPVYLENTSLLLAESDINTIREEKPHHIAMANKLGFTYGTNEHTWVKHTQKGLITLDFDATTDPNSVKATMDYTLNYGNAKTPNYLARTDNVIKADTTSNDLQGVLDIMLEHNDDNVLADPLIIQPTGDVITQANESLMARSLQVIASHDLGLRLEGTNQSFIYGKHIHKHTQLLNALGGSYDSAGKCWQFTRPIILRLASQLAPTPIKPSSPVISASMDERTLLVLDDKGKVLSQHNSLFAAKKSIHFDSVMQEPKGTLNANVPSDNQPTNQAPIPTNDDQPQKENDHDISRKTAKSNTNSLPSHTSAKHATTPPSDHDAVFQQPILDAPSITRTTHDMAVEPRKQTEQFNEKNDAETPKIDNEQLPIEPETSDVATRHAGTGEPLDTGFVREPAKPIRFSARGLKTEINSTGDRLDAALAAANTYKKLKEENREPTDTELTTLHKMVGFGADIYHGSTGVYGYQGSLVADNVKVKSIFKPDQIKSFTTSFFTPPEITRFMWDAIEKMGLNNDHEHLNVLDGAVGTGHFIGHAPKLVREHGDFTGIELDEYTADIAKYLYPEANIVNSEFQKVQLAQGSQDIVIGNPPYTDVPEFNPRTKTKSLLHDMFLTEGLHVLREGGLLCFVTSSGTMDKSNEYVRKQAANTAELAHAIRLPGSAFTKFAGTSVMTDIIFLRVLPKNEQRMFPDNKWIQSNKQEFDNNDGGQPYRFNVNQYFVDNPQHIIGELTPVSSQFGMKLGCHFDGDIEAALAEQLNAISRDVFSPRSATQLRTQLTSSESQALVDNYGFGGLFSEDNQLKKVGIDENTGQIAALDFNPNESNATFYQNYITLRDTLNKLIETEKRNDDFSDQSLDNLRRQLREAYATFVNAYGPLNSPKNTELLVDEPFIGAVLAVEEYNTETQEAKLCDIAHKRVFHKAVAQSQSGYDAICNSIGQFGHIDEQFVVSQSGESWANIESEYGDKIIRQPDNNKLTLLDVYLSGDMVEKLESAKRAAKLDDNFKRNVALLESSMPQVIPFKDIYLKLGSTWIPDTLLTEFLRDIASVPNYQKDRAYIRFHEELGTFEFKITKAFAKPTSKSKQYDLTDSNGYSHPKWHFYKLFDALLMHKPVNVRDDEGNIIPSMTQMAKEKLKQINDDFILFCTQTPERIKLIESAYNARFNRHKALQLNHSIDLEFKGMASHYNGRPFSLSSHQKDANFHHLLSPHSTLLAHEAGAGKTISFITIMMKQIQMGNAKKGVFVVPNNMLYQPAEAAVSLFPDAKVLTVQLSDLTPENRVKFANKIRFNNYDLIVCTQQQFERIPLSPELIEEQIEDQLMHQNKILSDVVDTFSKKVIEKKIKGLKAKLDKLYSSVSESEGIYFDELGIDMIAYDEAHFIKNFALPTSYLSLPGICQNTSARAFDADLKFGYLHRTRGDEKGVILGTGTPIANTIGESVVYMRYLAPSLLKTTGLDNFDEFVSTFGEVVDHIELTPEGSGYQTKQRLSKFHNITEYMSIFSQVAHIRMGQDLDLSRPDHKNVYNVAPLSDVQKMYMDYLSVRAIECREGDVDPTDDNILKIYNDLRKSSIDQRLIDHRIEDNPHSKINAEVDRIFEAWQQGHEKKETQIVFFDMYKHTSTTESGINPKTGKPKLTKTENLNLLEDMQHKLLKKGIPKKDIFLTTSLKKHTEKDAFYNQMREGSIRIALATGSVGVGANMQDKGRHIRHMSFPLRGVDIEQRNKRFVRQGNGNSEVFLHYPTTKDSGDMGILQMIERKDEMRRQLFSANYKQAGRKYEEDEDVGFNELMALTSGNSDITEKLTVDLEVVKLTALERSHRSRCNSLSLQISDIKHNQIKHLKQTCDASIALNAVFKANETLKATIKGKVLTKHKEIGALAHNVAKRLKINQHTLICNMNGIDVYVDKELNKHSYLYAQTPTRKIYEPLDSNLSSTSSRLFKRLKNLSEIQYSAEDSIKKLEDEVSQYEQEMRAPFAKQKELESALSLQQTLETKLSDLGTSTNRAFDSGSHPFNQLLDDLDHGVPFKKAFSKAKLAFDEAEYPNENNLTNAVESIDLTDSDIENILGDVDAAVAKVTLN